MNVFFFFAENMFKDSNFDKTHFVGISYELKQVHIGSHTFTYDFVYGNGGYPCSEIYNHCVAPLVDALFKGYNATVLAYGQVCF